MSAIHFHTNQRRHTGATRALNPLNTGTYGTRQEAQAALVKAVARRLVTAEGWALAEATMGQGLDNFHLLSTEGTDEMTLSAWSCSALCPVPR